MNEEVATMTTQVTQAAQLPIVEVSDTSESTLSNDVESGPPSPSTNSNIDTAGIKPQPLCTTEHLGKHRQYWRDMILGVNDGLVSTFLLVAGVAGAGLATSDVLLTALAGALAGALSMASGEYVATKSQNEVLQGEIKLERKHISKYRKDEMDELSDLLKVIGIHEDQTDLRREISNYYESRPEALLKIMVALEFGVVDAEIRSAWAAGALSGLLFTLGSLPSVLPFLAMKNSNSLTALIVSAVATSISLLLVGAISTWATRGNCARAAMENLLIAGFGGASAYGVGILFDRALN